MKTELHNPCFVPVLKKRVFSTLKRAENTWICGDTTTIH